MDQSKKDPTKSNLMYLTIFLLLTISASRELAMSLNAEFRLAIKLDLVELKGTSYTYADLVFVSVYGLIKNGPRLLKPIYKSIIAILSNLAPYTKCLCKEGCDGLMYLVQVFANNRFLMEKEDNCKTLGSLIEAINYLIAYHDETNHYLQIQLMKYYLSVRTNYNDINTKIERHLHINASATLATTACDHDRRPRKSNISLQYLEKLKIPGMLLL